MRDAFPAILAIVLGVMILQLGNGLVGILVPLRMGLDGLSPSMIGVVATFYSLGFLVGCFLLPVLVRRIGHIRAFAVLAALVSAGSLGFTLGVDWLLWGGIRFVLGICMAGLFSVSESWIVAQAPQAIKGRVLSLYMVCNKLTLAGGQMLVMVGDPMGIGFFLLISVCASLSLVPVA
ncbi:MAG: MFS transporter, partial [Alphaproteobacteria bacterium]|nr:MFS transporter [Alphaproteobacteria bacterium]